jgi:hypothetical protein
VSALRCVPLVVRPSRYTTMSLGAALSRAIVVPVDILLTTGVLGHCLHVDITILASIGRSSSRYSESAPLLTTLMLLAVGQIV